MSHDQASKQKASTQITTLLSLKIIYKLRPIASKSTSWSFTHKHPYEKRQIRNFLIPELREILVFNIFPGNYQLGKKHAINFKKVNFFSKTQLRDC